MCRIILELQLRIREEAGPILGTAMSHTEVRLEAIRREMERKMLERKLLECAGKCPRLCVSLLLLH